MHGTFRLKSPYFWYVMHFMGFARSLPFCDACVWYFCRYPLVDLAPSRRIHTFDFYNDINVDEFSFLEFDDGVVFCLTEEIVCDIEHELFEFLFENAITYVGAIESGLTRQQVGLLLGPVAVTRHSDRKTRFSLSGDNAHGVKLLSSSVCW